MIEKNLLLLDDFRKQLGWLIDIEEDEYAKDYLNGKYKIYSKVCDIVEGELQTDSFDENTLDNLFIWVHTKLWEKYTDEHWFLSRAVLILEGNQEAIDTEKAFINDMKKANGLLEDECSAN